MTLYAIEHLPDAPLAAASAFHARHLPLIASGLATASDGLVILFPAADHTHTAWRLAAVQGLAREQAPKRVNAVAGTGGPAIAAAVAYLEQADGVTGQYLPTDPAGAGDPLLR